MRWTLKRTLLSGLTAAIVVALVPAGLVLDRLLVARLEEAAREDLGRAPMVLKDRNAARADALMMHAREVAAAAGLGPALAAGRREEALRLVRDIPPAGEAPVLWTASDGSWAGPAPGPSAVEATRRGEAPVSFVLDRDRLFVVSVAPVEGPGGWQGVAGVAAPAGEEMAATLAGLTAAEVVMLAGDGVVASTLPDELTRALARGALPPAVSATGESDRGAPVASLVVDGRRFWYTSASLGDVGRVVFAVDRARELALLPGLRRGAGVAALLALGLALALGGLLTAAVARPVRTLATATDRLSEGDFRAPLAGSRIEEVGRMARAFARMREALEARLAELSAANAALAERQARLQALQSELIRRDRLAASGRLVTELAHEIRNPVANIRNCLEVVHRRLGGDPEGRRFADLAIDELLRMHELSEQMLDLNRPMDPGASRADAEAVIRQIAALYRAGARSAASLTVAIEDGVRDVAMPPDTLKQVLLSLVQNAREAMGDQGAIRIRLRDAGGSAELEVADEGPGIPEEAMDRIFDPFFTTKGEVSGVGLGLFIAHGLVTRSGGRLTAENTDTGATFRLEIPFARAAAERPRTAGEDRTGVPAGGSDEEGGADVDG